MIRLGSSVGVAMRWVLVCLLALDFIGAPLHGHPRRTHPDDGTPVMLQLMEGAATPRLPIGPESVSDHAPVVAPTAGTAVDTGKDLERETYGLLGELADSWLTSIGRMVHMCGCCNGAPMTALHRSVPPEGRGPPVIS